MSEAKTDSEYSVAPFTCHRCGEWGHGYRECKRPPARTETELKERFARYMTQVIAGRIPLAVKRQWVKDDWTAFRNERERTRK